MMVRAVHWREVRLPLGDTGCVVQIAGDATAHRVLLNLHRNEVGSVEAAVGLLEAGIEDLRVARFVPSGERLLAMSHAGRRWLFDPNRVFSPRGIAATLSDENADAPAGELAAAAHEVAAFADAYRDAVRIDKAALVVALHNTGDEYSIHSYAPGGRESAWTEALHLGDGQHRHDFFLVTTRTHFDGLAARGYNVVLERYDDGLDDGSLSVYCARRRISYVNCEARYDAPDFQRDMLRAALAVCGG